MSIPADRPARVSDWELVGIPYTSMRHPGRIADAIGVLRASGPVSYTHLTLPTTPYV